MNHKKSKLEDIFFKYFFISFLISVLLSTLVSTIFLTIFTNNYYDIRTMQNIINLEKQNSKMNINSANDMVTSYITKLQINLNELILEYEKIANDLIQDENSHILLTDYFVSAVSVDEEFCDNFYYESEYMGTWLYDQYRTNDNLDDSIKDVKLELTALSHILQNLDTIMEITWEYASPYFFYFEKTELYMTYPLSSECYFMFLGFLTDFYDIYKGGTCVDENGEYYRIYKMKCQDSFINMLKSRTNAFDNNYLLSKNKTIFVNNFYFEIPDYEHHEFTMCIEFIDPITKGKGYACVDASYDELVFSLDNLNENIKGYYLISNVGFNNVFYFPLSIGTSKIPTQYIFDWNFSFYLNEKVDFYYNIKNYFSSNYINYVGFNIFEEIYVNGTNSNEQYFYADGIKYNYSIYPIVFENLNGQKEHTFSIIYVYNNDILLEGLKGNIYSFIIKIILELVFIIIFNSFILYLINLSFNTLSKYIVIPIKNVNYMLKGINIGGEYRENYLNFLKRKQDENLEKLEKIYFLENKQIIKESDLNSINDKDNLINGINKNNKNYSNNFKTSNLISYNEFNKKYDEESNHIEEEYIFYDFNEKLL